MLLEKDTGVAPCFFETALDPLSRHRHEPLLAPDGAAHVFLRLSRLRGPDALHRRRQVLQHEVRMPVNRRNADMWRR